MKLAILSDFHLGYERFREDAFKQAKEALESASNIADALLIPGDIFDARAPKPDVLAEAINLFMDLSKKKWEARAVISDGEQAKTSIPIIAIPGTHERRAVDVEDPVDLLHLAGLLIDISNSTAIIEKNGEKIAVRGIGGIADERFKEAVKQMDPKPVKNMFSIFMFHESIYELLPFNNDFIRLEEFPKGFNLYINGHIHHKLEEKIHGAPLLIPGSTVLTQLKDGEQSQKGFFIFDTKTREYAFQNINSRRFIVRKIAIEGKESNQIAGIIKRNIDQILETENEMPVIRIILEGKLKDGFKKIEMGLQEIPKKYKQNATVEISNKGVDGNEFGSRLGLSKNSPLENISVRDYGLNIFMEKMKQKKYSLKSSPVELFEMLSAEGAKEKVVKKALENLLDYEK